MNTKVLTIKAAFFTYNDMQTLQGDKSLIRSGSFCALVVAVCPFRAFVLFSGHVLVQPTCVPKVVTLVTFAPFCYRTFGGSLLSGGRYFRTAKTCTPHGHNTK